MKLELFLLALAAFQLQLSAQQTLPPGTSSPDQVPAATAPAQSGLADAEDKIEQKDYPAAQLMLQKYLNAHPGDARGLFDLGYLADLQEQPGPAAENYHKAIAADPRQFEARLALGLLLARQGEADAAREQITTATKLEPATPNTAAKARALRALAQLDRTKDPAAAKQALLEALKISAATTDDTLLTAELAEASNDPETAEAAYRRVLSSQPDSSAGIAGLVHLLLREHKYPDAEALLRSALARDPDDPALNSQLASALMAENKPEEGLTVLRKLHRLQAGDPLVARMLADSLSQSSTPAMADDLGTAEAIYQQLLTKSTGDADLLDAYGQNLIKQKKYPQAMGAFQKATTVKPEDGDAWAGLAFASSELHQYTTALDALTMRSKYLPDTPATYFLRATAYDSLHVSRAAAENYQRFLAMAQGKYPDQEWQAKHRLTALEKSH